jgi:hypothetical protein
VPSSPSYYVANSPSNRLYDNHRKRQYTAIQGSSDKPLSPNETPLYKRLRGEQPTPSKHSTTGGRCQHNHQERARQLTSHYLLPTASSLQRRISLPSSRTPDRKKTTDPKKTPSRVIAYITPGRDHHDRLAELQVSHTFCWPSSYSTHSCSFFLDRRPSHCLNRTTKR